MYSRFQKKLSSLVTRKEPPSDLWTKCGCGERTLYVSDLKENLNICSYCDYHMNMDVNSRLKNLFGDNAFEFIEVPFENNDPLKFKDLKKYSDRMKAAQKKTDQKDAAILAQGEIGDTKVVVFILDFNFMGGSMGSFAMLGDIIIAEKGSMIGFAGKRVIEETIKEQLPEDFQTAEYLLEHGMIDMVVHRKELNQSLSKVLSFVKK